MLCAVLPGVHMITQIYNVETLLWRQRSDIQISLYATIAAYVDLADFFGTTAQVEAFVAQYACKQSSKRYTKTWK